MMETEEEFPSQTSGFCLQDIKFTVSIKVKSKKVKLKNKMKHRLNEEMTVDS